MEGCPFGISGSLASYQCGRLRQRNGESELDEALSKAQSENKPVMVDFYTDWCNPCRQMDKYTYSDDVVSPLLNENFIFLKVNVDKSNLDGRFGRFWCCYLCPLGAIFGAFNPVSILKVKVDFSKCNHCENCLKVCPQPKSRNWRR